MPCVVTDAVCTSLICISIVKPCFPKWRVLLLLVTYGETVVTAMNHALKVQKGDLGKGTPDHGIQRIFRVAVGDPAV